MGVELYALHWIYLFFILFILGVMIKRRDTTLVCIAGIFTIGCLVTRSISGAVIGIFNSFAYAITELLGTILIISIIVGMGRILTETGINEAMIRPFTKVMKNPALSYWTIGILMMVISWFFWPSPAVALIGAVLLPAAVDAKLPALAAAMAMNLFGHGIALSGDFVIQGAPKLTADGAGIAIGQVVSASMPLVAVMGITTTIAAFYFIMKDMKSGRLKADTGIKSKADGIGGSIEKINFNPRMRSFFAVLIPLLFAADIVVMYLGKLKGGDATALIGGTAAFILILITAMAYTDKCLEKITAYLVEGFQFGFKVFGPVIPIAAFFYLGDSGITSVFGKVLPEGSSGIVNDLGIALSSAVPLNPVVGAGTLTAVGAITGLDGSGFSGISLAGSIARLFGTAIGRGTAVLTALGQISAIWVGGGTLIPWAVIPVAAICNVDPFELVRRNLKPVIIGLIVTTITAVFLI